MKLPALKLFLFIDILFAFNAVQCFAIQTKTAPDTISLKSMTFNVDDTVVALKQLSANNKRGGGLFVQIDSVFKEGIIAFDNPQAGKQWIRADYLNDSILNVHWNGSKGDGKHEDAESIQKIIEFANQTGNKSIYFPTGLYLIEKTINLHSNLRLYGEGTLIAKRINPILKIEDKMQTTFFPTTIFIGKNINSITIDGLTFDGNWQANKNNGLSANQGRSNGTPEEFVSNLIRIVNSKKIEVLNCRIKNYSSNWGGKLGNNGAVCFDDCSQILLKNIRFSESRTEGILLLRSKNIVIEKLATYNNAVWTPIHAWYCNDLKMNNCEIIQQIDNTGSTFNLTSSNVQISNSTFIGGAGIDLGNEAAESFDIHNITIKNCIIENNKFGIYSDIIQVTDFNFFNNYVHVGNTGLSLYNFKNCLIENNFISAKKEETFGIKMAHKGDKIQIKNNIIHADCGIQGRIGKEGEFLSDIEISGNIIKASDLNNRSDYQAFSSGIYFRKYSDVQKTYSRNITISDNRIYSEGSWIFIVNQLGDQSNFKVIGNYCYSSSNGCKRGFQIGFNKNLIISNNSLYDCAQNIIVKNEDIEISNNRITLANYAKTKRDGVGFILRSNSGNRNTINNSMYNNVGDKPFFYTPSGHENSFLKSIDKDNRSIE